MKLFCRLHAGQKRVLSACSQNANDSRQMAGRKPAVECRNRGLESHENLLPASHDSPIARSACRYGERHRERTAPNSASPACSGRQCTFDRYRRGCLSSRLVPLRPSAAASRELIERSIRRFPCDLVLQPHFASGWKAVGIVERGCRHIDRAGIAIVFVRDRAAAYGAEPARDPGRRSKIPQFAGEDLEGRGLEGQPSH